VRGLWGYLTVIAVAAAAAVATLFLWLRTYDPLTAVKPVTPGAGLGADVEPTYGSGGKSVFIPAYEAGRDFDVTFTLRNTGRFAVTLTGLEPGSGPVAPHTLRPSGHVRIDPHDAALVTVRWRLDCPSARTQAASDRVRLRYRYLSLFRRTGTVELPFAVTLRCSGGPPASP
jgi:hypothetical protein